MISFRLQLCSLHAYISSTFTVGTNQLLELLLEISHNFPFSMCLSAPASSLVSTSLTSYLVNLNPILLNVHTPRAPPDLLDVSEYPFLTPSALAFDSAVGEVTWLGVPGPS